MDVPIGKRLGEILAKPSARIHLVGVAGSGMSALARLLLDRGYRVSGSDLRGHGAIEDLVEEGLCFSCGHSAQVVEGADLLCYSSAIPKDNPERKAALEAGIPAVRRAELLAALAGEKKAIVVTGMHGKSTTAALLAFIFRYAGKNPSYYVGAEVPSLGRPAQWTPGEHFILEGDESDGTILCFRPSYGVILNIDEEHLDFYQNLEKILSFFSRFIEHAKEKVVYCADDPNCLLLCSKKEGSIGAGLGQQALYRAQDLGLERDRSTFRIHRGQEDLGVFELSLPGIQNVCNALVAAAVALELGIGVECLREAMREFRGARRRFEVRWQGKLSMVVDDYAHHPTEIRATLSAARLSRWKRTVALFQPHRYSRAKFLREQFAQAFKDADLVFLTEIYAACEAPLEGVNGESLAGAIRSAGHGKVVYQADLAMLLPEVADRLEPGDLFVTLGAGNIHEVAARLSGGLRLWESFLELLKHGGSLGWYRSLGPKTRLGLEGRVELWCEPASLNELLAVVRRAREESLPVGIVGRGTALCPFPEDFFGVLIALRRGVFLEARWAEGRLLESGAGALVSALVEMSQEQGLGGWSYLSGWPGSLGSLLATARDPEFWKRVQQVWWVDPSGELCEGSGEELWRKGVPDRALWVRARIALEPLPARMLAAENLAAKESRLPAAAPERAAFAFEEPLGLAARELFARLGLGGRRLGRAYLWEPNPVVLVCEPGAVAREVLELLDQVRNEVSRTTGISLRSRIRLPELLL
jgi:UDP-N-acetylmuramate--alanine ligase